MGIEPTTSAWEAEVLPLNYIRMRAVDTTAFFLFNIKPKARHTSSQKSPHLCELIDQAFRLAPSKARICDRLAVAALSDGLRAVFQIAFYHQTFNKPSYVS